MKWSLPTMYGFLDADQMIKREGRGVTTLNSIANSQCLNRVSQNPTDHHHPGHHIFPPATDCKTVLLMSHQDNNHKSRTQLTFLSTPHPPFQTVILNRDFKFTFNPFIIIADLTVQCTSLYHMQ